MKPSTFLFGLALASVLLTGAASAQTSISGNIYNGAGGPLSGLYVATGNLTVPLGQTLTIAAGTIIKFQTSVEFDVNGTLTVNGTSGSPVILTSYSDDSAGGDTNANGASTGSAADWRGMVFSSTSGASSLTYLEVRYTGSAFYPNVKLSGANITMSHCTLRNGYTAGLDLSGNSNPTVSNCTFTNNGQSTAGYAVDSVDVSAISGFSTNTATGNGTNSLRVTGGTLAANRTINASSMITGAVVFANNLTVNAGVTLTLNAGVIIKFNGGYEADINGTLTCNGTSGAPVIFTALADDSAGGDTNSNGASTGSAAAWRGLVFSSTSSSSSLNYTESRYAGSAFYPAIWLVAANITLTHCTARDCYTSGLNLNGNSYPTVSNCSFTNNGAYAVDGVDLRAAAGFNTNVATGNNGNYIHVTTAAVSANLVLNPSCMISGALAIETNPSIASGVTLTLNAGMIFKFATGYQLGINGALITNGTAVAPVIFTGLADDSAGGDTNGNGPSAATPATWYGLVFAATSGASSLTYAEVRYGGSGYYADAEVGSNATFNHCTFRDCFTHGMNLTAAARPSVSNCTFSNNGGPAVDSVDIAAVPGFVNNTASGNTGNYINVTAATVSTNVTIGAQSMMNGALVLTTNVTVQPAGTLTLNQGVVVKFSSSYVVTVDGILRLHGTSYEPVVLTSLADDSFGGDTNSNGPSSGSAGTWYGIVVNAGAGASSFENAIIRYSGAGYYAGLTNSSPNLTLRAVRADNGYANGFYLAAAAGNPANLIAYGCGSYGIQLVSGSFNLVHATAAGNATGIRGEATWTGSVVNSIAWGNTTNFSNIPGSQVTYSDGIAGGTGNINVNPQFASLATGDLHLLSGSPCINTAELLTSFAVQKDFDENSRILDAHLTGAVASDMGAYEYAAWDFVVNGVPKLGTNVFFTVQGPPGISLYGMGILDGVDPIAPYGFILIGATPYVSVVQISATTIPVGTSFFVGMPGDVSLAGLSGGIQTLTTPTGNGNIGNFTRMWRATLRP